MTMLASSAPRGTGGHAGDLLEVHVVRQLDLLGVYLQDGLAALQVRQLHRNPPVEPSRTGQRRVQGLGPVGGSQDDDAGVVLKAVHLGQQLVQGLLPLVVAAHAGRSRFLADGVDLVDEHDAGGLLLGLLRTGHGPWKRPCPRTSPRTPSRTWKRRARWTPRPLPWPAWSCRCPEGPPAGRPWACERRCACICWGRGGSPRSPPGSPWPRPPRPRRRI